MSIIQVIIPKPCDFQSISVVYGVVQTDDYSGDLGWGRTILFSGLEQSSNRVHLPSIGKSLLISVSSGWLPYSVISNVSTSCMEDAFSGPYHLISDCLISSVTT